MARELKTGWVVLATSGSVIHGDEDGRFIKKEWLQDMAEVYNTKVFTAKLWPDHHRYYNGGKVVALKLVEATEPELKGEFQLLGILAPTDWLIRANQAGDFTQPSIEVGENYRGTGKFFLKGLGVTDEPASAGAGELKFSSKNGTEKVHVFPGQQFNLAESLEESDKATKKESLAKRIFSWGHKDSNPDNTTQDETPMTEEQLAQLKQELGDQLDSQFNTLADKLANKPEENEGADADDKTAPTATEFKALKDENTELNTRLKNLETKFSELEKTPAGSTKVPEGTGDSESRRVL